MSNGLPVSRLISASVSLNVQGAAFANLNSLLIIGDSDVIDTDTRIETFGSLNDVAALFGTTAPEYEAAALFFGQAPQPTQLYIGRWAQAATSGRNFGGILSASQKLLSAWTSITTGAFHIPVDGVTKTVSSLDFSAATNLNDVASIIDSSLTGASVTWDGNRFVIKSDSTGAASVVGYASAPGTGVDISDMLKLQQADGARLVAGVVAETALQALTKIDGMTTYFYGVMFASTHLVDADRVAIAGYVQGAALPHLFGITVSDTGAIDPTDTTDVGSVLAAAGYTRTFGQYSQTPYAVASAFGRLLTVDFDANNSVISLMYKQEPGVTAETLTSEHAAALDAKRYNYFVNYDNNTAILQNGACFGQAYIDEIFGTDWLSNRIQTDVFNVLYGSGSKVPQTDAGNALLAAAITSSCAAAVNNGLLAPGTWTGDSFGQLKNGDFMSTGFYVYVPPVSQQATADRAARKSVAFQVAAKLAGAVDTVDISINVNR